jgi:CRISPR-associated protein Csm5
MKPALRALAPEEVREVLPFDIQVVSPVHIGTREGRLSALEFVASDGSTHIVDEDRFGRFLRSRGLIDLFVNSVGRGPFSMGEFLANRARVDLKRVLGEIASRSIPGGAAGMTEFRPFVRDGNGQVFLPGTSLKGVFRTALLWGMLQANEAARKNVEDRAGDNLGQLEGRGGEGRRRFYSSRWLQEDLLQRFGLVGGRTGPNQDILRCLTVRDAYAVSNVSSPVIRIQFLSKRSSGAFYWSSKKRGERDTDQPLEVWVEALIGGTFRTELAWDRRLFEEFQKSNPQIGWPVASLNDVLAFASGVSGRIFEHERAFYADCKQPGATKPPSGRDQGSDQARAVARSLGGWYSRTLANPMRIGFGSGMLSTTVNILFREELRQKIRDVCGHRRPGDPAPKSRRVWKGPNEQWMPLGWMRFAPAGDLTAEAGLEAEPIKREAARQSRPAAEARPQIRATRLVEEKHATHEDLMRQADLVKAHDRFGLERLVQALDRLENEEQARSIAETVKKKLQQAGVWEKHPLRGEIELLLS